MMTGMDPLTITLLAGSTVTLLTGAGIIATKRWHSRITADGNIGTHKFHDSPTIPRVGGLAVLAGYWASVSVSAPPARGLLLAAGLSAGLALLGGLAEDLTGRISPITRLITTMLAGLTFCFLTGYMVQRVEIAVIDDFMTAPIVALGFTAFAMGGVAHAVNMIDGFHGLATGTTIILLIAFSLVASQAGDLTLVWFCLAVIGVLAGFAVLNFPLGSIFLGDGGAYFAGFVLACVAVMVPMRNPEVSPWISIVVLAYPLMETAVSFVRKIHAGTSPLEPDGRHLHMLIYRHLATRLVHAAGAPRRLASPATAALAWSLPLASLIAVAMITPTRASAWLACALLAALYVAVYWPLSRLSPTPRSRVNHPDREDPPVTVSGTDAPAAARTAPWAVQIPPADTGDAGEAAEPGEGLVEDAETDVGTRQHPKSRPIENLPRPRGGPNTKPRSNRAKGQGPA